MTVQGPIDIEKENLEAHVELCASRYENLDKRLTSVEQKLTELQMLIQASQNSITRILIGTAGTVITGILGLVVVVLQK
jgi:prefoldin subunit 5